MYEMLSFHFHTHFHACDTLPQVFQCALILVDPFINKILVNNNTDKTRQVNVQQ